VGDKDTMSIVDNISKNIKLTTSIAFAQGQDVEGSKDQSTILLEVSLNALSYSFTTRRLENGIDLRYMPELLGYRVVRTIMIYTHVLINKGGLL